MLLLIGPAAPRKKVPIALSSRRRVGLLDKLLIEVVYGDQWRDADWTHGARCSHLCSALSRQIGGQCCPERTTEQFRRVRSTVLSAVLSPVHVESGNWKRNLGELEPSMDAFPPKINQSVRHSVRKAWSKMLTSSDVARNGSASDLLGGGDEKQSIVSRSQLDEIFLLVYAKADIVH